MVSDKQIEAAREIIPWVPAATIRAALLAAERAAWEDISTAPRDGTRVQTLNINDGTQDVARWEIDEQLPDGGVWSANGLGIHPTRWRPLPAAPEASDAE